MLHDDFLGWVLLQLRPLRMGLLKWIVVSTIDLKHRHQPLHQLI